MRSKWFRGFGIMAIILSFIAILITMAVVTFRPVEVPVPEITEEVEEEEEEVVVITGTLPMLESGDYLVELEGDSIIECKTKLDPSLSESEVEAELRNRYSKILDEQQIIKDVISEYSEDMVMVKSEYFSVLNGISIRFENVRSGFLQKFIDNLKSLPGVKEVYKSDPLALFLDQSVPQIGASTLHDLGVRGDGVTVAVIDTGVDYTHDSLGGGFGEGYKVNGGYDLVDDDPDPHPIPTTREHPCHGTGVAGVIAADPRFELSGGWEFRNGRMVWSRPRLNIREGVAPNVNLHAFKVDNSIDVIGALEMIVDPDNDPISSDITVDIINYGMGGYPEGYEIRAFRNVIEGGAIVVAAVGNKGDLGLFTNEQPVSCLENSIVVGSVDNSGRLADNSGKGLSRTDLIKPDLVAPGVDIETTGCDQSFINSTGTSFAAPHVAGAAALIRQMHPDWPPQYIRALLMGTASPLRTEDGSAYLSFLCQGAGMIDLEKASYAKFIFDPPSFAFAKNIWMSSQPSWDIRKQFEIINISDEELAIQLHYGSNLPPEVEFSINPDDFRLGRGERASFTVHLYMSRNVLPSLSTGLFEGHIITQFETKIPFVVFFSPMMKISFDRLPKTVIISEQNIPFIRRVIKPEETDYSLPPIINPLYINLPIGTYEISAVFEDPETGRTRRIRKRDIRHHFEPSAARLPRMYDTEVRISSTERRF